MAKHIRIEPDCPKCGREMTIVSKGFDFTEKNPWGEKFEAWYRCGCGFETAHGHGMHRDEAKAAAEELAKDYMPN